MSWWFCGQSPIDLGLKGWMRKPLVILSQLKKVWMVPRSFLVKHLLIDSIFLLIFEKWKLYWKLSLESVGWVHDGSVPWRALTLLRRESCLLPNTRHSLDMLHIQHNSYIYLVSSSILLRFLLYNTRRQWMVFYYVGRLHTYDMQILIHYCLSVSCPWSVCTLFNWMIRQNFDCFKC